MEVKKYLEDQLKSVQLDEPTNTLVRILMEDVEGIEELNKEEIDRIVERLSKGEPIQYVTGVAPFYGHFFKVNESVLIPRPETEELVYHIEKFIKKSEKRDVSILDIGTGSGCIPITLSKLFPASTVKAIDVSEKALEVAKDNNDNLKGSVSFKVVDFLDESSWDLPDQMDIIVSNPPYIPYNEADLMPDSVKHYEPEIALFIENKDPLIFYKKILKFAQKHHSKASIFLECNEYNCKEVGALFECNYEVSVIKDLQGKDRIIEAIPGK